MSQCSPVRGDLDKLSSRPPSKTRNLGTLTVGHTLQLHFFASLSSGADLAPKLFLIDSSWLVVIKEESLL